MDEVNPAGPVFLSYRQTDGTPTAVDLSWLLRAAGVPVWHDATDLPPGDTSARLREALSAGIAGAVLIVTPDIKDSVVVRTVELPELLSQEPNPAFVFAIANTIRMPDGRPDYAAPDALLQQSRGTLSRLKQYPGDERSGLLEVVREVLRHRLLRAGRQQDGVLVVNVQTRSVPVTQPLTGADLNIRTRSPMRTRLPHPDGLRDLADGLAFLPEAVSLIGAATVRVTGGAHLSAAFALGAALPSTLVGSLHVIDTAGDGWTAPTVSVLPQGAETLAEVGHGNGGASPSGGPKVLVYADLLPSRSDGAYARLLDERSGEFIAWSHLRQATPGPLDPSAAGALVAELAYKIRALSDQFSNAESHLLLRCPFPVAVLLGRLTNTLRVVVYEWDDEEIPGDPDVRARYVAAMRVRATASASPVDSVLLP